ncbi:MAG: pyridoxal phosphate-dependent aminotransferase [Bifidobacteriaceae bacterium]|jgi:aspartate aminotransferase|nr:pyridoxal phosphate-dependent aminotransferase [Bifidobacteriaceae bacterium]
MSPSVSAEVSATLAVNEAVARLRASGREVVHLGFGEAGLPVLPEVAEVLSDAARLNSYGPVAGQWSTRAAVAGWFTRRGIDTRPEQIIVAPGSKAILFALIAALSTAARPLVLPQVAWVSYAAQARFLGRRTILAPVPAEAGGLAEPDGLRRVLAQAGGSGWPAAAILFTLPDNPTGTMPSARLVEQNLAIAREHGLAVISDEIYADTRHTDEPFTSPAALYPERTVVTSGLSKSMALGGYRIGFARLPANDWGDQLMRELSATASELWSSLALPMQAVLAHVAAGPPSVVRYQRAAAALHAAVAQAVSQVFTARGATCRPPQAAFYIYPSFAAHRRQLARKGILTSADLARALLDGNGIATLPGSCFGDQPEALTLRVATSMLYGGDDEQRWAALASPAPTALEWIAADLGRIADGLDALLDGP